MRNKTKRRRGKEKVRTDEEEGKRGEKNVHSTFPQSFIQHLFMDMDPAAYFFVVPSDPFSTQQKQRQNTSVNGPTQPTEPLTIQPSRLDAHPPPARDDYLWPLDCADLRV